jgi:hypothetical protein
VTPPSRRASGQGAAALADGERRAEKEADRTDRCHVDPVRKGDPMTTLLKEAKDTGTAVLQFDGRSATLPVIRGTENEMAVDIEKLRAATGLITLDPGYGNTGSCKSAITFIDGEKGILRYRGYPIEQLAEKSTFLEVAWLLIRESSPPRASWTGSPGT